MLSRRALVNCVEKRLFAGDEPGEGFGAGLATDIDLGVPTADVSENTIDSIASAIVTAIAKFVHIHLVLF